MKQRLLSLLLVIVMIVGMVPVTMVQAQEEEFTAPETITMDFKDMARQASKQDFWKALPQVQTQDGGKAVLLGTAYGTPMESAAQEAYASLRQWMSDTYGWTINETESALAGGSGNRLYLSGDDNVTWGMEKWSYLINLDDRNSVVFDVDVPAEGWYNLELKASLQNDVSTNFVTDYIGQAGGGYGTIYVNDEAVYTDYSFIGTGIKTSCLGAVWLQTGTNTVRVRNTKDLWAQQNITGRSNADLISMTLTPLEAIKLGVGEERFVDLSKTWLAFDAVSKNGKLSVSSKDSDIAEASVSGTKLSLIGNAEGSTEIDVVQGGKTVCTIGVTVAGVAAAGKTIRVNFKEFAKRASSQNWWKALPSFETTSGSPIKRVGGLKSETRSAEEAQAVRDMDKWMRENLSWRFDVEGSGLNGYNGNRVYFSAENDIAWGVARNGNINFTDGTSDMAVIVQADAAGWYDLTMELVHQSEYDKDWPADKDINAGGGYFDLYVNGEKVVTGYATRDSYLNPTVICSFGSVYLTEGENTIAARTVGEYNVPVCPVNGWTGGRSDTHFVAMTLTPDAVLTVEEGSSLTVPVQMLLAYNAKVKNVEAATDKETVATVEAAKDFLTVTGVSQGSTTLSVTSDKKTVKVKINVTEKDAYLYDFTKAASLTAESFAAIESYDDLLVDDVASEPWRYASGTGKFETKNNLAYTDSEVSFVIDVPESGWFDPQLTLRRGSKSGIAQIFVDDVLLGSIDAYASGDFLQTNALRPVELEAGEHTLKIVMAGRNNMASSSCVVRWHDLRLVPMEDAELTLDAGDLAERKGRLMQTNVTAGWNDGRLESLYGVELSIEVSHEDIMEASITQATLTEPAQLQVLCTEKADDMYVDVTAELNGLTAHKRVYVDIMQTPDIVSMDATLHMAPTGVLARSSVRDIVYDMPGVDGSAVSPFDEVDITYEVSDPSVIYADPEKHTLTALANGEADLTITVKQKDKTFTKTIPVTVEDAGINLYDEGSSSFEGETLHWTGYVTGEDKWATAEVADDGTGNKALKVSINPNTTANLGTNGFDIFPENGWYAEVEPGHLYELTFRLKKEHYKRADGALYDPRMMMVLYDWRGNGLSTGVMDELWCNTDILYSELEDGQWYELSVPVRAPVDASTTFYMGIDYNLRAHYADPAGKDLYGFEGTFWIDDIELREVGFDSVKIDYVTEPFNTLYPFKVSARPQTSTGHEILLDEGCAKGNFTMESSDENVLRVVQTPTYIRERANLWTEYWANYAVYDVNMVGKNDTATLTATCTIGDITREGTLDVTISGQNEMLRDIYVELDGFEAAMLPVGGTATTTISGLTTELVQVPQEQFASVYFTSSDPEIASVDAATGEVTCLGEGTVTITGYGLLGDTAVKGTATLTVTDDTDLVSIAVDADTDFVAEGNYLQLTLSGKKASGVRADMNARTVSWRVDDEQIAVVSDTGRLTALKAGTVTVTATVGVDGKEVKGSKTITVMANEELPANIVTYSFINGNGPRMDTATLEKDGIEIDRNRTYKNFEGNEWQKTGFVFNVPVDAELYIDFMVQRSGWYKVEVRGCSIYYYGCLTGFYIDNTYVGSPDFGADSASNYDAGGVFNTIYLEAGKHTMRLRAEEARRILLGEVTMYPVADPNEISFEAAAEKNTLILGESTKLQLSMRDANRNPYFLHYAAEAPSYTNYYTVKSSNPSVIAVSNDLFDTWLTAKAAGSATITVEAEILGKKVSRTFDVSVEAGTVASADLTAEFTTVRPDAKPFPLTVKAFGADGVEKALPAGTMIYYTSEDTSVATVSEDGIVTVTGKEGSALIKATVVENGHVLELSVWITVSSGKTAPTVYTWQERATAQENCLKYDWAWALKEEAVKAADFYVEHLEQIYNMWPHEGLPRSAKITYHWDELHSTCMACGFDTLGVYGDYYQWLADPIEKPWKITCPHCGADFPSNDFASFYECGLDERGRFTVERAMANGGEQYLVNELYPDKPADWGVDNGFGYFTGEYDSQGRERVRTYIAYYMHQLMYILSEHSGKHAMPTILDKLREAYIYTGDEKYGNAGAILLDRMADIYPGYSLHYYNKIPVTTSLNSGSRGKIADLTWECVISQSLAKAADAFWPCADSPEVVDFLRKYADIKGVAAEEITPDYLRTNVENGILREIADAVQRDQIDGNFGMHQASMALAAVALDTMPETQEWIDWIFKTSKIGGLYHEGWNLGGDVSRVLIETVDRDGFGNEGSIGYNYLWLGNLLDLADALNGYERAEQYNLWSHPKFVNMYKAFMPLTICGRLTVNVHETPCTWQYLGVMGSIEHLTTAYVATKDKEIAQMLYDRNGNSVAGLHADVFTPNPEAGIRSEVQAIIDEIGMWDMSQSTLLAGQGEAIGILRYGPAKYVRGSNDHEFFDTWMNFGLTNTHTHWEAMNMELDAFGLPLNGNMGYPESMTGDSYNRLQWNQHTVSNNTVLVNDEPQKPNPEAGFPLHFDGQSEQVKLVDADAPNAYDAADIYRRTVVTVKGDNGIPYTVDLFRILGGSEHVYSFHGATRIEPTTEGLTMVQQPFGTYAGADVPFGDYDYSGYGAAAMNQPCGYSWLWDVYRDGQPSSTFSVDWEIEDHQNQLTTSKGIHMRLTMVNDTPMAEVALADGRPSQNGTAPDHVEFMLVRNSGKNNLDTLFSSVIEPYQTEIQVASVELADMELTDGTESPMDRARALKVTLNSGRVDYIIYATNVDCTYLVDGKITFRGFVGVCTYRDGVLTYAYGNETELIADKTLGTVIDNDLPRLTGTVLDFSKELTTEASMVVSLNESYDLDKLTDQFIYVENDGLENAVYRIYGASRNADGTVTLDMHTQDFIREFIDEWNLDLGYRYNIAEGMSFTIPLASEFDVMTYFSYTADTVVRTGNKLTLNTGVKGAGVTYKADGLVSGMKLDANTGTLTWTPAKSQAGRYPITVKAVRDGKVLGEMSFVIYAVTYSGSSFSQETCKHARVLTYEVDGITETVCVLCGLITKQHESESVETFDVAGANMTLGNELKLNILVEAEKLEDGDYTVKITHNGETVEKTLERYNSTYFYAPYSVSAKQMSDVITAEVYKDGVAVSNVYETSVRSYAMNILNNGKLGLDVKTLVVDMLNYGAQAQMFFGYNVSDLANARLNAAQKDLATDAVECRNLQVKGSNFYGSNLSLEDRIILNLFFRNCEEGMSATVSYTDYNGTAVSVDAKLVQYKNDIYKVVVDEIVLADAFSPVTVTVYKNGTTHGSATDSVESYVARNAESKINEAIMKFAFSAKAYLG